MTLRKEEKYTIEGRMENYLSIEIISKSNNGSSKHILSRFLSYYMKLYCCHPIQGKSDNQDEKQDEILDDHREKIFIGFDFPDKISTHFQKIMKIYDSYLLNSEIMQQTKQKLEKSNRIKVNISPQKFMIIKIQTDLKHQFKDYYNYLNHLLPILDMGGYIEEVADGFLIFFDTEEDYEMFFFDLRSKEAVNALIKRKHIILTETLQKKIDFLCENL